MRASTHSRSEDVDVFTTRVACLGDSITRAQFSADYLPLLREGASVPVHVARFGVNGDFGHNLASRLDEVVVERRDVITVLIGTNDARASLAGFPVAKAMRRKRLPARPSLAWFEDSLVRIVERLSSATDARIGLLSLPVLGQDVAARRCRPRRRTARRWRESRRRIAWRTCPCTSDSSITFGLWGRDRSRTGS